jgi:hypothetical protein
MVVTAGPPHRRENLLRARLVASTANIPCNTLREVDSRPAQEFLRPIRRRREVYLKRKVMQNE